jgi:hypothetical protein
MVTWRGDRARNEDDSYREVNRVHPSIKRGLGRYAVLVVGLGVAGVAIGWFRGPGLVHDIHAVRTPSAAP